jgi:hypothetical protein
MTSAFQLRNFIQRSLIFLYSKFVPGTSPMSSHWLGRATLPEGYLTAVLGEPSRSPETWSVTSSVVGPSAGARVSPRGYVEDGEP